MGGAELIEHQAQVGVAAEEGQVVARPLGELARHQRGDRRQRVVAVGEAGGQVADRLDLQLLGAERRLDIDPRRLLRQAEQVGVVVRGAQGRGEQGAAVGGGEARGEEGRRHYIADAQGRGRRPAGAVGAADVEQRMAAEGLGEAAEQHGVQVEVQQLGGVARRLLAEVIGEGADGLVQGHDEQVRGGGVDLIGRLLVALQLLPVAVDPLQRALHHRRGDASEGLEAGLLEFGGVHAAAALDQVVRLVHQQGHAPFVEQGQAVQQAAQVEVVVVVADHHVGPAAQFLAQVIGADAMRQRGFAHAVLVQPLALQRGLARGRQAVVEALGQRAGVAVAGLVRVFAGLVAGDVFEHPQRHRGFLAAQGGQGVQRQAPAGGLGGEEEQAVQRLLGEGLELRKQGAEGLADAGGGLGHQAVAVAGGAVHRLGQLALAAAKLRVGKAQALERLVAQPAMRAFLFGPGDEAAALQLEELTQFIGTAALMKGGFVLAEDVEIDHRQIDLGQAALLAQQPAVDLGLGPVQQPVVLRNARDVAAVGLDLFQAVVVRGIAVGPAAHLQAQVFAGERQLRLVARAAPGDHDGVAAHALLGGRRGGEAQIQVADLGGEFAQRAHRDLVVDGLWAHASAHST
ncbi:hypothetical protein D3C85_557300 [compost metagenome]